MRDNRSDDGDPSWPDDEPAPLDEFLDRLGTVEVGLSDDTVVEAIGEDWTPVPRWTVTDLRTGELGLDAPTLAEAQVFRIREAQAESFLRYWDEVPPDEWADHDGEIDPVLVDAIEAAFAGRGPAVRMEAGALVGHSLVVAVALDCVELLYRVVRSADAIDRALAADPLAGCLLTDPERIAVARAVDRFDAVLSGTDLAGAGPAAVGGGTLRWALASTVTRRVTEPRSAELVHHLVDGFADVATTRARQADLAGDALLNDLVELAVHGRFEAMEAAAVRAAVGLLDIWRAQDDPVVRSPSATTAIDRRR